MGLFDFFKKKPAENVSTAPVEKDVLYAPVPGEIIPLSQVEDEVFSSGMMGNGAAIVPSKGEVYAPCNGTITTFFPTGHAIGIAAEDGAEVLIHVGMDTVSLNGEGFTPKAKEGDKVKKGQLLLKFDIDFIKSKGLPVVTPMIVTNTDDYASVDVVSEGAATNDTPMLKVTK